MSDCSDTLTLDRRQFLGVGASLVVAFAWHPMRAAATERAHLFEPNAFIRIGADDRVTLICKFVELGQGVHTGAATLVAEELDADWSQMRIESAPVDLRFSNTILGMQATGGSSSMAESWTELRTAGATARAMLAAAAAEEWGVAVAAIDVDRGVVLHRPSGRSARFGALAQRAAQMPIPTSVKLKDPASYRLIGRDAKRIDARAKSDGTAQFAIDLKLPDMKVAVVQRPVLFGATVRSFDAKAAKAVRGVVDVIQIPTGVAVIANSFYAAKLGRAALVVDWEDAHAEKRGSDDIMREYRELAKTPGLEVSNTGNALAAMANAAKRVVSTAEVPYLAHAPMEPLDCVVSLTEDRCEIWAGMQLPLIHQQSVAALTGLRPEQIKLNIIYAGGSFGRRTSLASDYIHEAVTILKARPDLSPLKVQWTREDDISCGPYRPLFYHRIEAGLDSRGRLIAWHHRLVGQPLLSQQGVDYTSVEGAKDLPYDVPALVEFHSTKVGVPVMPWRAVGNTHTAFAIETAIDELAHTAGRDPVHFRRELLRNQPRHLGVLELAAQKSEWGKPLGPGRGRGIALHRLQGYADLKGPYGSYVAQVAEVTVMPDARVKVDRIVCAIDCGLAINPNIVRDQMEGSIAFGVGAALFGAITLVAGRVQQSNFDSYQVMRMNQMPKVEVYIVPSAAAPTGVGEPGVPPAAPAVVNAVFAATGKRIRALPINGQLSS